MKKIFFSSNLISVKIKTYSASWQLLFGCNFDCSSEWQKLLDTVRFPLMHSIFCKEITNSYRIGVFRMKNKGWYKNLNRTFHQLYELMKCIINLVIRTLNIDINKEIIMWSVHVIRLLVTHWQKIPQSSAYYVGYVN